MKMQEIPVSERPRERCLEKGAHSLSLRECLALLLNSGPRGIGSLGLALEILDRPGKGLDDPEKIRAFFIAMEGSGESYLENIAGMGPANRARLLAAFELARRYATFRETRQASAPKTWNDLAHEALSRVPPHLRCETHEWLGFIPCYRSGQVGVLTVVEQGVRTHVNIEPIELFARILALRPDGVFLVHNHPSGDTTPSIPDHEMTERVSKLAMAFGVKLLGHWIVTAKAQALIKAGQR